MDNVNYIFMIKNHLIRKKLFHVKQFLFTKEQLLVESNCFSFIKIRIETRYYRKTKKLIILY